MAVLNPHFQRLAQQIERAIDTARLSQTPGRTEYQPRPKPATPSTGSSSDALVRASAFNSSPLPIDIGLTTRRRGASQGQAGMIMAQVGQFLNNFQTNQAHQQQQNASTLEDIRDRTSREGQLTREFIAEGRYHVPGAAPAAQARAAPNLLLPAPTTSVATLTQTLTAPMVVLSRSPSPTVKAPPLNNLKTDVANIKGHSLSPMQLPKAPKSQHRLQTTRSRGWSSSSGNGKKADKRIDELSHVVEFLFKRVKTVEEGLAANEEDLAPNGNTIDEDTTNNKDKTD